ncbi:hypothetical protein M0R72_08760 [Candidatus Pacearchaeota archaeon]|jgi:hypothetical protein|nr:hypothetical protein [Candidatus Pacearchaeota archaeon]
MAAQFVVQDPDVPTADANAYISVAFFRQYCEDRGYTLTALDAAIQVAIVKATDFMDTRWTYAGLKYAEDQSTECPRQGVINSAGYWVSGFPLAFQQACAEYSRAALSADLMPSPTVDDSRLKVKEISKSVGGAVSKRIVFMGGGGHYQWPTYPLADRMMRRSELVASSRGEIARG